MNTVPVQCRCGQVVQVARQQTSAARCPDCGAVVRASAGRSNPDALQDVNFDERAVSAQNELDFDNDGAGYDVTRDRDNKPDVPTTATWVPLRGRDQPHRSQNRWATRNTPGGPPSDLLQRIQTPAVELPGPFLSWSGFLYIFLYPTWARWIGLSLVSTLAATVLTITLFVAWIVVRAQLFLSIFSLSAMGMLNLALISYVVACFVEVIEETSAGEDRLHQLIDLSWWDILPRFFRVVGAMCVAFAITWAVTAPISHFVPADSTAFRIAQLVCWLQLFPILLITNLVDNTILPFRSLISTLRRLAARVGCFAAFQSFAVILSLLGLFALDELYSYHWLACLVVAGPLVATWTLYYGHWLGRLGRQLTDVD